MLGHTEHDQVAHAARLQPSLTLAFDEFQLDVDALELSRLGKVIKADPQVLKLLAVLVLKAGQLVTKQDLLRQVWGGRAVSENVITVAMVRLRRTLGHRSGEREFVINVHGRGYRFVRSVARQERPSALPSVVATPGPGPRRPPFVGRERLLQTLRDALGDACSGRGRACVLFGEAGIGKTRSVEVIEADALAAGLPVAWGTCREAGTTPPLWPFAELVRALTTRLAIDPKAPPYAAAFSELRGLLPELQVSGPVGAAEAIRRYDPALKHRIFDAFTRVLTLAAARTPLVLVLDDLHRADAASLELLRYLVEDLQRSPILVLATLRNAEQETARSESTSLPEHAARAHLAYVVGHRNCTRLQLPRLSESDVAAYVAALLDEPQQRLARAVFEKSEGIPFFMSELVRQLAYSERAGGDEMVVPDAALELVRQRVAALDAAAFGALSSAAVIGRSFELPVLQAVTQRDASELMNCLDAALSSEVLSAAPDSRTRFAFGHELLRNVLYEALAPAERRACHLKVALALEQRAQSGVKIPAAELAFHFHAALPDSDLRKTINYCARAAEAAAQLSAYVDSVRFVRQARQALDLVPEPSPDLRLELMLGQALAARVCADPEFESLVRDTIQLARERRAADPLARAALLLDLHAGFPSLPGSRDALEDALHLLPQESCGMRAAVLARLATSAPLAYDARRSRDQALEALALAQSSGAFLAEYAARYALLYLEGGPGAAAHSSDAGLATASVEARALRDTRVRESVAAIEQLCLVQPSRLSLLPILLDLHRAITAQQTGALAVMGEAVERCVESGRRLGSRELRWHSERFRAIARCEALDIEVGAAALRALHQQATSEGVLGSSLFCAYDRALLGRELGEDATAVRAQLRSAFLRDADDLPAIWSLKVRALATLGLREEAIASLRAVPASALADLPVDRDHLGTLGALARAALDLGALDYAQVLYELLSPYPQHFAAHVSFVCEGSVSELLGLLAAALGRPALATKHLEAGVEACERAGLSRCAARARSELEAQRTVRR